MRGVQKVKGNKDGFELLATESRELVYRIFLVTQDMQETESLAAGQRELLDQVLKLVQFSFGFRCLKSAPRVLCGISAFAEKSSSRSRLWAFVWARVNVRQIQKYRQALKCLVCV